MNPTNHSFDVFFSYHWQDHAAVELVARALTERGRRVFLDRWYLVPGQIWPEALEAVLAQCRAVATFLGPHGMGGWQQRETYLALDRQKREPAFPVIPVLLPQADPALGFLSLNTWIDLRTAPPDDPLLIEMLDGALRGQPPGNDLRQRVAATLATVCPYRGLVAFREEDAAFFFGKEQFAERLEAAVKQHAVVAVVGASGAGKSSVVRAGLLPRLRQSRSPVWDMATMFPTDRPLYALAAALLPRLQPELTEVERLVEIKKLADHLEREEISLRDVVERVLERQSGTDRLLLVVDQWEELYPPGQDESLCRRFIGQLLDATASAPLSVVLTIRGDFYGRLLDHRNLMDRMDRQAIVDLPAMNRDELRRAVELPAQRVSLSLETGLLDRIVNDVERQPGSLPLLEFALKELWRQRRGGQLSHAAYDAMGGVEGAVARRAEKIYSRLTISDQESARRLFVQLVRPGDGADDTRRRATYAELGEAARPIVRALADHRLIVTNRDELGETVEVAHEALIRNWARLRDWVTSVRTFRAWQENLRTAIRQWTATGRADDALLRGVLLDEAQRRLADPPCDVSPDELAFVQAATNLRERERAEQVEREKAHHAKSLVDSLRLAEITRVPQIVIDLQDYARWASPLIDQHLNRCEKGTRERLNLSLACLDRNTDVVDELTDELLRAESQLFLVLRNALAPYQERFSGRLWNVLAGSDDTARQRRLHAAAALAMYDPDGRAWPAAAVEVARQLAAVSPVLVGPWQLALRPAAKHLVAPLSDVFRDRERPEIQRSVACSLLADYAADQPATLVDLICDADPQQYAELFPVVQRHGAEAARRLAGELARPPATEVPDQAAALHSARRRAAAAVTLLRHGEQDADREQAFAALRVTDDPESLTQFVHGCRSRNVTAGQLRACLDLADRRRRAVSGDGRPLEDRVLYGLLLALGEFSLSDLPDEQQRPLIDQVAAWYRDDPSSAIHGASGWLLRHWQQQELAEAVERQVVPYDPRREWFTCELKISPDADPSFFLTFVVFQPGEYEIGSPKDELDRNDNEARHRIRLTRPFAILNRSITRAEVEAYGLSLPIDERVRSTQAAMVGTTWYDAVRFCRWLTERLGMAEEDQAYADPEALDARQYPRDPFPAADEAHQNWPLRLNRPGFRLPTEAEWEVACRAGSATTYSFGRDQSFLQHYAWFLDNSGRQVHVPGEKRPNLRGLFDMHGNVWEWCHDWHAEYEDEASDPVGPARGSHRVIRGGSWANGAADCRAADRNAYAPANRSYDNGFRPALSPSGVSGAAEQQEQK